MGVGLGEVSCSPRIPTGCSLALLTAPAPCPPSPGIGSCHPPYAVILPVAGEAAVQEEAAGGRAGRGGRWAGGLQPAGRVSQPVPQPAQQGKQGLWGQGQGRQVRPWGWGARPGTLPPSPSLPATGPTLD